VAGATKPRVIAMVLSLTLLLSCPAAGSAWWAGYNPFLWALLGAVGRGLVLVDVMSETEG